MAQRILLIGGNGFIGRNIIKTLLQNDFAGSIRVASRSAREDSTKFQRDLECTVGSALLPKISNQVEKPVAVDIVDGKGLDQAVDGADVVVNLVGIMEGQGKYSFDAVQHYGVKNIAEAVKSECAAKKKDIRFVHISALGANSKHAVPYARTKGLAEEAIAQVTSAEPHMSSVILRPSLVIGPEDQFLNRFSMLLKYLPAFPIYGGGVSLYQPIYIDDLCKIIRRCFDLPFKGTAVFDVGGPKLYTFKDLVWRTTASSAKVDQPQFPYLPLFIPVPIPIAMAQAAVMENIIPVGNPLRITRDQVTLLSEGSIVPNNTYDNTQPIKQAIGQMVDVATVFGGIMTNMRKVEDVYKAGKWLT